MPIIRFNLINSKFILELVRPFFGYAVNWCFVEQFYCLFAIIIFVLGFWYMATIKIHFYMAPTTAKPGCCRRCQPGFARSSGEHYDSYMTEGGFRLWRRWSTLWLQILSSRFYSSIILFFAELNLKFSQFKLTSYYFILQVFILCLG